MKEYQLGAAESRFADMIWESAPVSSTQLSKRCEAELSWKKSTTYTVLKRLCEKGLFQNNGGKPQYIGRMPNAAKNTTYVILSNDNSITFDRAWRASGLSSSLDDYFAPEEAVIVGYRMFE